MMHRAFKVTGYAVLGVMAPVVLAVLGVYGVSEAKIRKTWEVTPGHVPIAEDSAGLAWGRHIAVTRGCIDCHTADLGGGVFIDVPIVGRLFASNLTSGRGGVGGTYTEADWVRSIRHGVGTDSKPLLFMPSHEFNPMSDEDLGALIGYLRSVPGVDRDPVTNAVGPIARIFYLKGDMALLPVERIDHTRTDYSAPAAAATAEYGRYVATTCTGCHGDGLSGGPIPGAPPEFLPPANLTPDRETGLGDWTESDFVRAVREGKSRDGRTLSEQMPWRNLAQMTDVEVAAVWAYLKTLPATPYGNR